MDTYSDKRGDKYYKFSPITVEGYIVNHTDNINYDICLYFDSETAKRYLMVYKETFTYTDIDITKDQILFNPEEGVKTSSELKQGISYRCRLKKIDTIKPQPDILREVNSLIYFNNGRVSCVVSDVDIYNRLLVEIYDIDKTYSINNILLTKYPDCFKLYPDNNSVNKPRNSIRSSHMNMSGSSDFSWKKY